MRYFVKMTFSRDVLKIWLNLNYRDLNREKVGENAANHVAKWIEQENPGPIIRDNVKIVRSVDPTGAELWSVRVYY